MNPQRLTTKNPLFLRILGTFVKLVNVLLQQFVHFPISRLRGFDFIFRLWIKLQREFLQNYNAQEYL
ncbi:unnamed protein product [Allacma fusca]|uniref:Uncharacterized protein n=1 Tax=Allacma fusca TaxID=39272 RepID=A0A8J2KMD6_9HEXA|nr:unnamed protein product [Allacma fusca]